MFRKNLKNIILFVGIAVAMQSQNVAMAVTKIEQKDPPQRVVVVVVVVV